MSAAPVVTIACSACAGKGLVQPRALISATPDPVTCSPCSGEGKVSICTRCGARVTTSKEDFVCGCNSVALNPDVLGRAA